MPGRTVAYRIAEVRPQVNGILQQRLFTEGSDVTIGQPLYQIDAAPFNAAFSRAKAQLTTSKNLLQRYQKLRLTNAVSQQDLDNAQANFEAAQAEFDIARINLDYTKVLSPLTGRISRSLITEGALVATAQPAPLAVVQQLDPIYVDFSQSVVDLLKMQQDSGLTEAPITLQLEDGSRYPLAGNLTLSEVTVDEGTSSVTLRAEFPNPDGHLLPGMFIKAEIPTKKLSAALLVPQQAVFRDPQGTPQVWVVDEQGVVSLRRFSVSQTVGNAMLVQEGLAEGEQIITEGIQKVAAGMQVQTQHKSQNELKLSLTAERG